MSRLLVMETRLVDGAERRGYLSDVAQRRVSARAAGANFWVFEQDNEQGRFLEFVEAGTVDAIQQARSGQSPQTLWREVEGA